MIGRVIEGFEIIEKLGEGGMGVVYRATDTSLGRVVALKMLHGELTKDPQLTERFLSEARTQAQLNHPNLATLFRLFQYEGSYFMVMEFVNGETFAQMIRREGPVPQERAIPLFKQSLSGLSHAHHAGIIHRDIKPSNMMVNKDGIVKVMDFGIAKILGGRGLTATGVRLGTLYYMSPEQIRNQQLDIRTDIYALGITLYELLTGRVPFDSNSDYDLMQQHIQQPPPPPRQYYPYLSAGIEDAILQSLEKDPARRFQTVEAFSRALDAAFRQTVARSTIAAPGLGPAQAATMVGQPQAPSRTPVPPGPGYAAPQPSRGMTPSPPLPQRPPITPSPTMVSSTPLPRATPLPPGATVVTPTPIPRRTPTPAPPSMARSTPPPASISGSAPQAAWAPSTPAPGTPVPMGYPQGRSEEIKTNWLPIILAGAGVLALLVVFFVIRHFVRRPQPDMAASTAGTEVQQPVSTPDQTAQPAPLITPPVEQATPSIQEPAAAPPGKQLSTKPEETRRTKDLKKGQKNQPSPASQKANETVSAAQQALLQQQIEAERQRLAQQQVLEQQKAAGQHPAATKPPADTKSATYTYRVAHSHGGFNFDQKCFGTLTFSKTRVSYKADSGGHNFDVAAEDVREVKKNSGFWSAPSFHIRLKNGENFNLARISPQNQFQPPTEILLQMNEVLPPGVKR